MAAASAASEVSGTGSPEKTHGCAVHTPWPSMAWDTSTRLTFVTWRVRASSTAPVTASFSAPSTTCAAVAVLAALAWRPVQTRFVVPLEVAVPGAS
jgi:hypothetical protein